jgi:hypothetical protein
MRERISDFVERKRDVILDYLILLALAFVPFWRMGVTGIWSKADLDFPLYPIDRFHTSLTIWNPLFSTGEYTFTTLALTQLPIFSFLAFPAYIGVPIDLINRAFIILVFVLLGWGMYSLVKEISPFQEKTITRIACMVSSVFFMFNPYVVLRLYFGHLPELINLGISVVIFLFLIRGFKAIDNGKPWLKYAVFIAFLSTLIVSQVEFLVLSFLFFVLYSLYYILHNLIQRKKILIHSKFVLVTASLSVVLNLWWLLSLFYAMFYKTSSIAFLYAGAKLTEGLNTFLWQGELLQRAGAQLLLMRAQFILTPLPDVNWYEQWVQAPIFIILGLILFLLAVTGTLLRPRNKNLVFLFFITVFSLGLAMGNNPPFGPIYIWLIKTSWFFQIFKISDKFLNIAIVGYAVLLGVSVAEIYHRISNRTVRILPKLFKGFKRVFPYVVILVILINTYPMLSGNLNGVMEPMHVPSYYNDSRVWLKAQGDNFRVMPVYTLTETWWITYSWAPKYNIVPISQEVFGVPTIAIRLGEENKPINQVIKQVYDAMVNNQTEQLGNLLNLLNVRYVVIQDDLMSQTPVYRGGKMYLDFEKIDFSTIKSILQNQKDLELVKSFDALHFYENKAWRDRTIYAATALINTEGTLPSAKFLGDSRFPEMAFISGEPQAQPQYFDDFANLSYWANSYRTSLTVDTEDYMDRGPSIVASIDVNAAKAGDGWASASFVMPGSWNCTNVDYLVFWFEINSLKIDDNTQNALNLILYNNNGEQKQFIFTNIINATDKWYRIVLPLDYPWIQSIGFNASSVDYFRISLKVSSIANDIKFKVSGLGWIDQSTNLENKADNVQLSYNGMSATKLEIYVNTPRPFTLVFSETYDTEWAGRIKGQDGVLQHFVVNGYFNGWSVNKTGVYTIVLEYYSQTYVNWGITISVTSAIMLVGILVIYSAKKREN